MMFVLVIKCLGPCPEPAAPTMTLSSLLPSARGAWVDSGPGGLGSLPCLLPGGRGCLAAQALVLLLPRCCIRRISAGETVGAFSDPAQRRESAGAVAALGFLPG